LAWWVPPDGFGTDARPLFARGIPDDRRGWGNQLAVVEFNMSRQEFPNGAAPPRFLTP
jgi:hypothetical protein